VSEATVETLPNERVGQTETLATGEAVAQQSLARGQYKIRFETTGALEEAQTLRGETKSIKAGDEYKRVHFYKIDAVPKGETTGEGEPIIQVTAKVLVIDNPIPLVPIAWGAAGLVGLGGGGWLLFSSAESFVEDTQIPILTGSAAIVTLLVAYDQLLA